MTLVPDGTPSPPNMTDAHPAIGTPSIHQKRVNTVIQVGMKSAIDSHPSTAINLANENVDREVQSINPVNDNTLAKTRDGSRSTVLDHGMPIQRPLGGKRKVAASEVANTKAAKTSTTRKNFIQPKGLLREILTFCDKSVCSNADLSQCSIIDVVVPDLAGDGRPLIAHACDDDYGGENETPQYKNFDSKDPFCWVDLTIALIDTVYPNQDAMMGYMRINVPRVIALITKAEGFYLKKDDTANGMYAQVTGFKGINNFNVRWMDGERMRSEKFGKLITKCKQRRYAGIGCFPDQALHTTRRRVFNIWPGFRASRVQVDESKIQEILFVLREIWANGCERTFRYLVSWFRFLVAHPADMTKVALFLLSKEGAGKNFITEFLTSYVLGTALVYVYTGIKEFTEKHDTNKYGKKLLVCNEMAATPYAFRNNFDIIKPIISDPFLSVNPKGGTIFQVQNISNTIMTSNNRDSLYLQAGGRRYTCIQVSDERTGNEHKQWWAGMHLRNYTQEVGDHFYSWLLELDETLLPSVREVLQTELQDDIVKQNMNSSQSFLHHLVSDYVPQFNQSVYRPEELYKMYGTWCEDNGEMPAKSRELWQHAAKVMSKSRTTNGVFYKTKGFNDVLGDPVTLNTNTIMDTPIPTDQMHAQMALGHADEAGVAGAKHIDDFRMIRSFADATEKPASTDFVNLEPIYTEYAIDSEDGGSDDEGGILQNVVYAIRAGDTDIVKVGFSRNVNRRLTQLQTANHMRLHIEFTFDTKSPHQDERWMHDYLVSIGRHVRGEWFRIPGHTDYVTMWQRAQQNGIVRESCRSADAADL